MAIHARLSGRDAGKRRFLDGGVAVSAVDAFAADMAHVAELERLLDELVLPGDPGRSHQGQDDPACDGQEREQSDETRTGEGVGASRKQLTHSRAEAPLAYI